MMKPTIHLNGTSVDDLLEGYCEAGAALQKAREALQRAAPNGRDYYPQQGLAGGGPKANPNAIGQAVAEHEARMKRLHEVALELAELVEYCAEQRDGRDARRAARVSP